ncbi:PREDICTED: xyloglucan galactosyltransferase KATAMARI1 [Fragaria vesca subsp. vesca]|uniref:xyloglucan galactosyltransferase KATAMARI1 n=1 Tax=Fragaria vesca subsp. vesca TaxID=101020 RepID=UPI0002C314F3|nr:PREDICTED: xyloglucan galactosyltransferase KATAMARI1 [Fragaria vesca subsp. vesca]
MAVALSKRSSKHLKKEAPKREPCFCLSPCLCFIALFKFLYRLPAAFLLLFLIYLWSSSTTIISGNIVHVCISSRKLNNHYCLSAGSTRPKFELPNLNNATHYLHTPDPSSNLSISISPPLSQNNSPISPPPPKVSSEIVIRETVQVVHDESDPVKNGANKEREEEIANAKKQVEEQLRLHRSWISNKKHEGCEGRGVYVYDLPSKFNKDLLGQCRDMVPWMDFCEYFKNEALGESIPKLGDGWYHTHQYSLEPIFHQRILNHPCRVHSENEAKLFYVPFYGGLDILRWHFKNVSNDVKDTLSLELITWLKKQDFWRKNSGRDHVLVLGKISWDFRRKDGSWGTNFLEIDQMQNPIKLLIERQPWQQNDVGIPHPTFFHPNSDDDIMALQWKIISSYRKTLVSFAGAARPSAAESIRSTLIDQCNSAENGKCHFLNCHTGDCDKPESVIELFMESEFCLQPPGDSPTRKSLFDSLISGCIPVLFDPFTAYYQYPWHLPVEHGKYSVFIDQKDVRGMKVNVVEMLMKIPKENRDDMRRHIVYELLPGLVYGDSNAQFDKFQDAFSITMSNLMERVTKLELAV